MECLAITTALLFLGWCPAGKADTLKVYEDGNLSQAVATLSADTPWVPIGCEAHHYTATAYSAGKLIEWTDLGEGEGCAVVRSLP